MPVGADDDLVRPCRQVERHPPDATPAADHEDPAVTRLEAIAIGTDVNRGAEAALEPRYRRPDVLDADREQEPARPVVRAAHREEVELLEGVRVDAVDRFI